jgi:hypothetical protein
MYQEGSIDILSVGRTRHGEQEDEHEHDQQDRDDGSGAVIRIGSVASSHDARAEAARPPLPRPRLSVDQGTTTRPSTA